MELTSELDNKRSLVNIASCTFRHTCLLSDRDSHGNGDGDIIGELSLVAAATVVLATTLALEQQQES